ncbi:hypothetical protein E6W39_32450 [Kitasatospora acidiphila]|uniref:Uncharacterized protein n=1 Tax=Kitasatospora acidiphila TaxID=2567942 RepID=A0A540WAL5_9ACTN|nr:hypothetical protein [Kitasatospora acidiphila]TQF06070.1 hypothetical protein E6W39_32450 [Kitasatospora acidiphila]
MRASGEEDGGRRVVRHPRRHLRDSLGITLPGGEAAHTACVGIGLERLGCAFFCRHGTDPERWPATVRSLLTP